MSDEAVGGNNRPSSGPYRSLRTAAGRVLGIVAVAYYLIPATPLRLIEPGWWLTYALQRPPPAAEYIACSLFGLMTVLAVGIAAAKRNPEAVPAKNVSVGIPPWLVVSVLFVPIIAALANAKHNADIAPAICSTILAFSTGILAALLAGTPRAAIATLLTLVLIQSGFALYYRTIFGNVMLSGSVWREGGTFNDPEALSILAMTGAGLSIAMFARFHQDTRGVFYGGVAAASMAALLTTWSRGGVISLSLALAWFSIRHIPQRFVRIIIIVGVCLWAGLIIHNRSAGPRNAISAHQSMANRLVIWSQGVHEFNGHWLTGTGMGPLILHIMAPTSASSGKPVAQVVDGPKNVILYFLDELGIAGIIVLALAFITVHRMLKFSSEAAKSEAIALSTAWVALALYSLIDTTFGGPAQYCGNAVVGYLYGATILLGAYSVQKSVTTSDQVVFAGTHA